MPEISKNTDQVKFTVHMNLPFPWLTFFLLGLQSTGTSNKFICSVVSCKNNLDSDIFVDFNLSKIINQESHRKHQLAENEYLDS